MICSCRATAGTMPASSIISLGGKPGHVIVHSPETGAQVVLARNSPTGASRLP
jgi:hypothetical protein